MKLRTLILALMLTLGSSLAYAQGGGGGGGAGGGSAGGGASSSGSAVSSPSAGSAGAGSLGVNGMPKGPANAAGLNNSGNDPSGFGNATRPNQGTTGLANPSVGSRRNSMNPPRGTNSSGTANASGGMSTGGGGGRPTGKPTTTNEGATDATVNAENKKVDRAVRSICKGC